MKGHHDVYNRVMPRDNIVVKAHLHWDHEYKDVKVVQVAVLLEQIEKLAETYRSWPPLKESEKKLFRYANGDSPDDETSEREEVTLKPSMSYHNYLDIPLILCGDFNSLPHSGPYELISQGKLAPNH